ncbi:MAG: DUF1257 domain-containing protein, partial [Candidatus Eremiobacterota bacterium]
MSGIFVVSPILVAAPIVLAATTSVAAAMGFTMLSEKLENLQSVVDGVGQERVAEFDVAEARGLTNLINEHGPIVLERNDATVCFVPGKGRVQLLVKGKAGQTREELEALGRQVLDSVSQQYAYHAVVSDLKQRGFGKVEEELEEDGTIRLRLRRWD